MKRIIAAVLVGVSVAPLDVVAQNCTKGIRCGNTCIAANKTCRIGSGGSSSGGSSVPLPPARTPAPVATPLRLADRPLEGAAEGLLRCATVLPDARRLKCYDSLAVFSQAGPTSAPPVVLRPGPLVSHDTPRIGRCVLGVSKPSDCWGTSSIGSTRAYATPDTTAAGKVLRVRYTFDASEYSAVTGWMAQTLGPPTSKPPAPKFFQHGAYYESVRLAWEFTNFKLMVAQYDSVEIGSGFALWELPVTR